MKGKTIVMLAVLCALALGLMIMAPSTTDQTNDDGFLPGETKEFECVHSGMQVAGTLTEDGDHYILDATIDTVKNGLVFTGTAKGPTNHVRLSIYGPAGFGDVSYLNCEPTPLYQLILYSCTK